MSRLFAVILKCFKLLDMSYFPGEQIMCYYPDGKVKIWADRNAKETPEMKKRFADRLYNENVRLSSTGYNQTYPILNY